MARSRTVSSPSTTAAAPVTASATGRLSQGETPCAVVSTALV